MRRTTHKAGALLAAAIYAHAAGLPSGLLAIAAAGALAVANLPDLDSPRHETNGSGGYGKYGRDAVSPGYGGYGGYGWSSSYSPYDPDAARRRLQNHKRYNHRSWPHSLIAAGGAAALAPLLSFLVLGYPDTRGALPESAPLWDGLLAGFASSPGSLVTVLTTGSALGYLSHLFLDVLTTKGIWLFRPGGRRLAIPLVKKGRIPEPAVLYGLALALMPALLLPLLTSAVPS